MICLVIGTGDSRAQISAPPLTIPAQPPTFSDDRPSFQGQFDDTISEISPPGLSISVRADLLSSLASRQTVESDEVATQVLEADVRGMQTTTTSITVQTLDSADQAHLDVVAVGTVTSNTVGITPQARIASTGNHTFDIRKPVYFDGRQFLTKPAYGTVQARQFPQAVQTVTSGVPLFGPLGERIAWSTLYRRMPMSDAVVVRRVADDVLPRVNDGIDEELATLNRNWSSVLKLLSEAARGDTIVWAARSTVDALTVTARNLSVRNTVPEISSLSTSQLDAEEAAAVAVSQNAINRILAQQPIGGLTLSDTAMQNVFQAIQQAGNDRMKIISLLQGSMDLQSEARLFSIRLAADTPLSVTFDQSLLIVNLKFQVLPRSAPASQPHLMKIHLSGQDTGDGTWSVALRQVSVDPADPGALPDAWTTLISNQATQLVDRVPPSNLPRTMSLQWLSEDLPPLRIHRIRALDGWLRFSLRRDESDVSRVTRCLP